MVHILFKFQVTVDIPRMTLQSASFLIFHQGTANLVTLMLNLLQSHLQLLIPLLVFLRLLNIFRRLVIIWLQDILKTRHVLAFVWLANQLW